ncbi:MAG: AAA family ATPase [Desulfamplus sp.]|nr:AAA family ATPase [Desulfamplus sp.]
MNEENQNLPDPQKIEKEISEFLSKKFGGNVKIISPSIMPKQSAIMGKDSSGEKRRFINFDIKPIELVSYLDQYIVRQNRAKSVLSTKICTHFNRIKHLESIFEFDIDDTANIDNSRHHIDDNANDNGKNNNLRTTGITGSIKSNILMLGPTGVGKTYIIKLIAKKIGVPFVKADATKFSETGYVGGDVEDIIRDLVKEANDDIELAQYGIVYIDEIDKIAASQNFRGADVSRTGVQRALLKPMEETDIDLKVPHDPISMMQELENYHKTGKRTKRRINTANILFIVSGAFGDLAQIVSKRISKQSIGFGSTITTSKDDSEILKHLKAEDLVEFGFESEFIGRLPVRCVLEKLSEDDLYSILRMPNNPVILGKRLDFNSYGIDIVFTDEALKMFATKAFSENTGARGLVSAVEDTLIHFEEHLPSSDIRKLTVTQELVENPASYLEAMLHSHKYFDMLHKNNTVDISNSKLEPKIIGKYSNSSDWNWDEIHRIAKDREKEYITEYISKNWKNLSIRHGLTLSQYRCSLVAQYFCTHVTELGNAIQKIKSYYESIKKIEIDFYKSYDLNIVFEEDAVDFLIEELIHNQITSRDIMAKIYNDFYNGLNLLRDKSGKNRFFLSRKSLLEPDNFLNELIKKEIA